ncbi:hypothetical protein [Catenibacterium sp.]|uniref:hypothetical protein n=1 Tax=Catenibacterium sp. TaxID=2049022 RepID=UPI003AB44641
MNKKQIMIAVGAVVMIGVGATAYVLSGPKLELKTNKVNVEYGTTYTPKLKDIVKDYAQFKKIVALSNLIQRIYHNDIRNMLP